MLRKDDSVSPYSTLQYRYFLLSISTAITAVGAITSVVWLSLDYPLFYLAMLLLLTASAGGSLLLTYRGYLQSGARLLLLLSLATVAVSHALLGSNIVAAALFSGAYINLILLAGALFSWKAALRVAIFSSGYSTLISLWYYWSGGAQDLHLIPVFLAEFAIAAGVMFYFIQSHNRLARNMQSAANRAESSAAERRKSEYRFRRFIDHAPVAVIMLDEEGRYSFANPETERITGYSRNELIGSCIPCLSGPELTETHLKEYHRLQQQPSGSLETKIIAKDGSEIDVLIHTVRLDSRQLMAFAVDISERIQHENELAQAYRLAEIANNAKSEFLHTISHEVRTPLNTIIGMSNILKAQHLAPAHVSSLESIELSAYSLLGIFDEILDFASIESGDIELHSEEFDLFSLAEEALKPIILKAKEKELQVHCDFDPHLPQQVTGDYGRIKQVLTHLLHNAVKFTNSGSITFSMQNSSAMPEGPAAVEFSIKDTGIGIEPERQTEIFELFRQADNSSTKHYGGIGLGLTICSTLTELLQGSIAFSSAPAKGSDFHVTIPLTPVRQEAAAILSSEPHDIKKVIICTDNDIHHEQLTTLLKHYGITARFFTGQAACLKELEEKKNPPDYDACIVELDQLFQEWDDTALGRFIHDGGAPSGRLIALVPLFWEGVYSKVKDYYGFDTLLSQPITPPKLINALRNGS